MKGKNLFLALVLGPISIGSSFGELSIEQPEVKVFNRTRDNIPLVRVKVTLVGDKGTVLKGSIHITNLSDSYFWFLPGYAKVNALSATRWKANKGDIKAAKGNVKVVRKLAKARYLTNDGKIPANQVDDFTWTKQIDRLVAQDYREKLVDVLAANDEEVREIYLTKVKAYSISGGVQAQERSEIATRKFKKPGIKNSVVSIIKLETTETFIKYARDQHRPHEEYERAGVVQTTVDQTAGGKEKTGKVMNIIYGIKLEGE